MKKPEKIIILGIDPGIGRLGWAWVKHDTHGVKLGEFGCVETPQGRFRLRDMSRALKKIVRQVNPDLAAVEKLFFAKNVKTALQVSEARGATLTLLQEEDIPILEPTPLQVKQLITGFGHAPKRDLQLILKKEFLLKSIPQPDDAADALAIALWAVHARNLPVFWGETPK